MFGERRGLGSDHTELPIATSWSVVHARVQESRSNSPVSAGPRCHLPHEQERMLGRAPRFCSLLSAPRTRAVGRSPCANPRALSPPRIFMENRYPMTEGHLSSRCVTSSNGAAAGPGGREGSPGTGGGLQQPVMGHRGDPPAQSNHSGGSLRAGELARMNLGDRNVRSYRSSAVAAAREKPARESTREDGLATNTPMR